MLPVILMLLLGGCHQQELQPLCTLQEPMSAEDFLRHKREHRHCARFNAKLEGEARGLHLPNFQAYIVSFRDNIAGSDFRGSRADTLVVRGDGIDLRGVFSAVLATDSLRGLRLQGARGYSYSFEHTDLTGASFDGAALIGARFADADLTGVSFRGAELVRVRMEDVTLHMTDFTGASLVGAHITLQGPQHAVLVGVDLNEGRLDIEDWSGLELRHVDLRGAHIPANAANFRPRVCRDVRIDHRTRFHFERTLDPHEWCPGLITIASPAEENP